MIVAFLVIGGILGLCVWIYGLAGGKDEGKEGNAAAVTIVVFTLALAVALAIFGQK